MKARFAWIRTFAGAGCAAAAAFVIGAVAGCDRLDTQLRDSVTTSADSAELSELPPEFVTLISSSKPTVVDFYATWCPPCQEQKPLFADAKRQYGDVATFLVVDVDEEPAIAMAYEVESIPTLIVYKDGEVVERMVGVHSPEEIFEALKPHME